MLHLEFRASNTSGSEEEIFFNIFLYFYDLKLGPLARGFLGPLDFILLNLVNDY